MGSRRTPRWQRDAPANPESLIPNPYSEGADMVTGIIGRKVGIRRCSIPTAPCIRPRHQGRAHALVQAKTRRPTATRRFQLGSWRDAGQDGPPTQGHFRRQRAGDARARECGSRRPEEPRSASRSRVDLPTGELGDVTGTGRARAQASLAATLCRGAATHGSMFHRRRESIGARRFRRAW